MIGCPCVIQFDKVVSDNPDFLDTLFEAPMPDWYDESVRKTLIACYRKRIIGLCDVEEWITLFKDRALLYRPKFNALWEAYKNDLLDFSTSKARTSTVLETETMPDTQKPYWIENQSKDRPEQDVDAKLTIINPISADRYLNTRQASVVDYAGSSGLSTQTNLDDINHFRDNLSGFIMDFVTIFDSFFVGRY